MASTQTTTDDTDSIVTAFKDAMDYVSPFHKELHHDDYDGTGWIDQGAVLLLDTDVTFVGDIELSTFTDSEYVHTETLTHEKDNGGIEKTRAYGFQAGETVDYIDVSYLRTLANEVFDVSYDTMKAQAQTTTDEESRYENNGGVLFTDTDSEYRVLVLPVLNGDD